MSILFSCVLTHSSSSFHCQLCDFIENDFLLEQVQAIKELSDHITNLKRVGPGLGEYMYDRESMLDED
jgi:ferritin heavy chain